MRLDAMKTRYHGDYHLGQVWLTNNDFVIANYGGEPGLTWAERRQKHTPLRDVASMLFSLSEAGAAALDHLVGDPAETSVVLQGHVDEWERLAGRTFFRSYRKAMAGHPSCPAAVTAAEALVTLSLAERAISKVNDAIAQHLLTTGSAMRRLLQMAQRGR
jgi:maltose alpha-D-glucosyltransferase/alpha-amylase